MEHITRTTSGDAPGGDVVDGDGIVHADGGVATVELRYWAGAAEAAGRESERLDLSGRDRSPQVSGRDVRAAILDAHPGIDAVLRRCTLVHHGRRLDDDDAVVSSDGVIEVLPPFVGG